MTFEDAKTNLITIRRAWYNGTATSETMKEAAKIAADLYNQKAREVARRMGSKPQLTTVDKIMRNVDRAVRLP
jgi:hypothetical protein